jgi:cation:H+ antiporter
VSLPELFVAISALTKGSVGLSVGSMLGGNIIVVLVALGGTAIFSNWSIPRAVATFDMAYLLLTTVVVVLFLLTRQKLERKESALILLMYVIYAMLKTFGY